jgi:predicted RNase H-like nuclease
MADKGSLFVGADGCRSGWFTVLFTEDADWKVRGFPDVSSLLDNCSNASVILLDVPIGLREGGSQRRCDIESRKLLGPKRGSSVFPAPCRPAVCQGLSYKEASNVNEQRTGKRLPCQTWNIIPKIREVDILLSEYESARSRVREIHPEICFWALAGRPMEHSKKTRDGFSERKQVLQSVYPHTDDVINYAVSTYKRKEVARDDILDALSAAVTATVGVEGLVSIPETPQFDERGLRMEMVYASRQCVRETLEGVQLLTGLLRGE